MTSLRKDEGGKGKVIDTQVYLLRANITKPVFNSFHWVSHCLIGQNFITKNEFLLFTHIQVERRNIHRHIIVVHINSKTVFRE